MQELELLSESHNLVYMLTCIPVMKHGQWQALKVIGTYSDCANKAVVEGDVMCPGWGCFRVFVVVVVSPPL